ncbi:hypothetical protein DL96DRAFT_1710618 [Flagelloscypha sp. PMI_526]|nr:hypothetical protein DL96DRAFT_1710618 [Flagelloscypha sp. PMI_526]
MYAQQPRKFEEINPHLRVFTILPQHIPIEATNTHSIGTFGAGCVRTLDDLLKGCEESEKLRILAKPSSFRTLLAAWGGQLHRALVPSFPDRVCQQLEKLNPDSAGKIQVFYPETNIKVEKANEETCYDPPYVAILETIEPDCTQKLFSHLSEHRHLAFSLNAAFSAFKVEDLQPSWVLGLVKSALPRNTPEVKMKVLAAIMESLWMNVQTRLLALRLMPDTDTPLSAKDRFLSFVASLDAVYMEVGSTDHVWQIMLKPPTIDGKYAAEEHAKLRTLFRTTSLLLQDHVRVQHYKKSVGCVACKSEIHMTGSCDVVKKDEGGYLGPKAPISMRTNGKNRDASPNNNAYDIRSEQIPKANAPTGSISKPSDPLRSTLVSNQIVRFPDCASKLG